MSDPPPSEPLQTAPDSQRPPDGHDPEPVCPPDREADSWDPESLGNWVTPPQNAAALGGWAGAVCPATVLAFLWIGRGVAVAGESFGGDDLINVVLATVVVSMFGVPVGNGGGRLVGIAELWSSVQWPLWTSRFLGGFVFSAAVSITAVILIVLTLL